MRIVFEYENVREEVIEAVRNSTIYDFDSLAEEYGWEEVMDAIFCLGIDKYRKHFDYSEKRITEWLEDMFYNDDYYIVKDFYTAKEIVEQEEKAQ